MSQLSLQDDGPFDALPQFAQDSPTVGRQQTQYVASVASNPSPALDLGKRFVDAPLMLPSPLWAESLLVLSL